MAKELKEYLEPEMKIKKIDFSDILTDSYIPENGDHDQIVSVPRHEGSSDPFA